MKRNKWLIVMTGLVGLAMTALPTPADAAAAIRFTVTGGGSLMQQATGGAVQFGVLTFNTSFTTADYNLVLNTSNTNYPGGVTGSLFTSVSLTSNKVGGLADLTVLAEVVDDKGTGSPADDTLIDFTSPIGNPLHVTTATSPNSPHNITGSQAVGSSIVNGVYVTTAPVLYNGLLLGATKTMNVASGATYTLANQLVFSGMKGPFNALGGQVSTTVAVPEPSSLALTGLVALGLGGFGVRRRLRGRAN